MGSFHNIYGGVLSVGLLLGLPDFRMGVITRIERGHSDPFFFQRFYRAKSKKSQRKHIDSRFLLHLHRTGEYINAAIALHPLGIVERVSFFYTVAGREATRNKTNA